MFKKMKSKFKNTIKNLDTIRIKNETLIINKQQSNTLAINFMD
jgi:hypothetical protein